MRSCSFIRPSCSGVLVLGLVHNEIAAYRMFYLVVWITTYAIVVGDCLTTLQSSVGERASQLAFGKVSFLMLPT